jgi:hypothetical protein
VSCASGFSKDTSTQQFPADLDELSGNDASAPAALNQVTPACHEPSSTNLLALGSAPGHAQPIGAVAGLTPHLAVSETLPPGQSLITQTNAEAPDGKLRLKIKLKPMTAGNKRGTKLRPGTSLTARYITFSLLRNR